MKKGKPTQFRNRRRLSARLGRIIGSVIWKETSGIVVKVTTNLFIFSPVYS